MAKLPEKIQIEAQDLDKVQTLIDLLGKYQDDLPCELKESLLELADCDACVIDNEKANKIIGGHDYDVLVNGRHKMGVVSFNPILKRLNVYSNFYDETDQPEIDENSFRIDHFYPESFELSKDGKVFYSWAK